MLNAKNGGMQRAGNLEDGSDKVRVDLDEEVAVMAFGGRLPFALAIRKRTERPLDIPAGPPALLV
jgi:hypothetical protein